MAACGIPGVTVRVLDQHRLVTAQGAHDDERLPHPAEVQVEEEEEIRGERVM